MTVAELRKALEGLPDEMEVFHRTCKNVRRFTDDDGDRLADVEESADGFAALLIS